MADSRKKEIILQSFEWNWDFTTENGRHIGGEINLPRNLLGKVAIAKEELDTAIYWEGNFWDGTIHDCSEIDWDTAVILVNKIANILKGKGLEKNDEVLLLLPNMIQLPLTVLAAASLGLTAVLVDPTSSVHQLSVIISTSSAKCLITVDAYWQAHVLHEVKRKVDEVLGKGENSIEKVIVIWHVGSDPGMPPPREHIPGRRPYYKVTIPYTEGRDELWAELFLEASTNAFDNFISADHIVVKTIAWQDGHSINMNSHTAADILYNSHEIGKHLRDAKGLSELQRAGHLIMGPLWEFPTLCACLGALHRGLPPIIYEGPPDHPDPSRPSHIINKYKVSTMFLSASIQLDADYIALLPTPSLTTILCQQSQVTTMKSLFPQCKVIAIA